MNVCSKFVGLKNFVGQSDECKVKIIRYGTIFEAGRFGKGRPDPAQISKEGLAKIRKGGSTEMVADDEEKEGPRNGSVKQGLALGPRYTGEWGALLAILEE